MSRQENKKTSNELGVDEETEHPVPKIHFEDRNEQEEEADHRERDASSITYSPRQRRSWSTVRRNLPLILAEGTRQRAEQNAKDPVDEPGTLAEKEAWRVLQMLRQSDLFKVFPEKSQKAVILEQEKKAGKIHALDILVRKERGEIVSDDDEYIKDRKQKEKEEEDNRLQFLWNQRDRRISWIFLGLFHASVLINFILCICESYRITVEHCHMDRLFLDDEFNCLDIINSGDWINSFFNILHAFACTAVLFTDRLGTANICWALVFAQLGHAISDTFMFIYNLRIPTESHYDSDFGAIISFVCFITFELLSTLVYIQRYYDMTNILRKRTQGYTSSIFGGRLLNEQIIYKNESTFLQKKFLLRQATSLQIYGIVQKIQHYKDRGLEPEAKELAIDVKAAIAALKDVQQYKGTDLLKELRKRNVKRLKELKNKMLDHPEDNSNPNFPNPTVENNT